MRILAVDPGYDRCGVAVIEKNRKEEVLFSSCISTKKSDEHADRLAYIFKELESIIADWKPEAIALETLFFSVNKKTAIKVAEARGVILLICGLHGLQLIELSPQAVKLCMTGVGNATKEQVQKMVGLSLGLDISKKLDDELDAIALGVAAVQKAAVENFKKGLAK